MTDKRYYSPSLEEMGYELNEQGLEWIRDLSESAEIEAYLQKYNNEELRLEVAQSYIGAGQGDAEQLAIPYQDSGKPLTSGIEYVKGDVCKLCQWSGKELYLVIETSKNLQGFPFVTASCDEGARYLVLYHDYERACAYCEAMDLVAFGVSTVCKLGPELKNENLDKVLKIALNNDIGLVMFDGELYDIKEYFEAKGITDLDVESDEEPDIDKVMQQGLFNENMRKFVLQMMELCKGVKEKVGFPLLTIHLGNHLSSIMTQDRERQFFDELLAVDAQNDDAIFEVSRKHSFYENIKVCAKFLFILKMSGSFFNVGTLENEGFTKEKLQRWSDIMKSVVAEQLQTHNEFYVLIDKNTKNRMEGEGLEMSGVLILFTDINREQLEEEFIIQKIADFDSIKRRMEYTQDRFVVLFDGLNVRYDFPIADLPSAKG